ncbi:hypothetical protein BESB_033790 [Besnoitia besnoiti]|uniref:SRS domain-containing protein n=1 Tax=Besnoitia besnoiti TaxID=94643 RepID=A0A2A9MKU8_BESBE|nr:hypothetical protein BESB_033790 [Besnoitia besnoiti]PFH36921.1 hypothetical protein BESB_033790 [Besnoitia besnoiti]
MKQVYLCQRLRFLIGVFLVVCILSGTNVFSADGAVPSLPQNVLDNKCEPQAVSKDARKVLTLTKDLDTISFSCGSNTNAKLSPDATSGKFYATEQCSTDKQKTLKDIWGNHAVLTAQPEVASQPKVYQLTIPKQERKADVLYYSCSIDEKAREAKLDDAMNDEEQMQGATETQKCTVIINVTSTVLDPLSPPAAQENENGYHEDGAGAGAAPAGTCDPGNPETQQLHLTLEPGQTSVKFNCGSSGDVSLTPSVAEKKFCVDASCEQRDSLSALGEGAALIESKETGKSVYTLTVPSKPEKDQDVNYTCNIAGAVEADGPKMASGTKEDKICSVKISVRAEGNSPTSASLVNAASCSAVGQALFGLLFALT